MIFGRRYELFLLCNPGQVLAVLSGEVNTGNTRDGEMVAASPVISSLPVPGGGGSSNINGL